MKIEKKDLWNSIIELTIEAEAEEILKYKSNVISYLRKNADINWFRKWSNIPEDIILRNFSQEYILNMTIEFSIESIYKKALMQEWLIPVAEWKITQVISQSPLIFKAEIEVLPSVEIDSSYRNIHLQKTNIEVSESEIDNTIKEIETKFTSFVIVEDQEIQSKLWDRLSIDTTWYDLDWNILEITSMKDFSLILWTNILVTWFEEWLVWYSSWSEIKLDIKFPEDYHNQDFKWKETKFKVKINKLEQAKAPIFDEDFIEKIRWKRLDFEGFRKLIKEELLDVKTSNSRLDDENRLIDELIKLTNFSIWPSLIENQTEKMFNEIKENMLAQNIKINNYLESLNLTKEEYKEKNLKESSIRRLKWELILNKISSLEKIESSDEELNKEIEIIKSSYQNPKVLERLDELYKKNTKHYEELKTRLWYRKLIDSFFN